MESTTETKEKPKQKPRRNTTEGTAGLALFMGFIGAMVHYMQHATSFGEGVLGVLKSFAWPAMLVYEALEFFNK